MNPNLRPFRRTAAPTVTAVGALLALAGVVRAQPCDPGDPCGPPGDCDNNGVPDAAEIAANPDLDCNANGVLDVCEWIPGEAVAWRSAVSGQYLDPARWCPAGTGLPGAASDSIFAVPGAFAVGASGPIAARSLYLDAGAVSFDAPDGLTISPASGGLWMSRWDRTFSGVNWARGRLAAPSAALAVGNGSFASMQLGGGDTASMLDVAGAIRVGLNGYGSIHGVGDVRVSATELTLGSNVGSYGTVMLRGDEAGMQVAGPVIVRRGALGIIEGASASAGAGFLISPNTVLYADGQFSGNIVCRGQLFAGYQSAPGVLELTGDLDARTDATNPAGSGVFMYLAGTPAGRFSALRATGDIAVAGGLYVGREFNFQPLDGDRFEVIRAEGTLAGRFDAAYFPGLSNGRFMYATYDRGDAGTEVRSMNLNVGTLQVPIDVGAPQFTSVAGGPTAAALGDLNRDGLPDLAILIPGPNPTEQEGSVVVLFNTGNPEDVWGSPVQLPCGGVNPRSIVIGQFDDQPGNDIAIANFTSGTVSFLTQTAVPGQFALRGETFDVGAGAVHVAVTNLDREGRIDLAVANSADGTVRGLRAMDDSGFGFSPMVLATPGGNLSAVEPFNPDRDKDIDLVVSLAGAVRIIENVATAPGQVSFALGPTIPVPGAPVKILVGKFDGDDKDDFVTINLNTSSPLDAVTLVLSDAGPGGLAFSVPINLPLDNHPITGVVADLDGDGSAASPDPDIAVLTRFPGAPAFIEVLRNDRTPATEDEPGTLAFAPDRALDPGPSPVIVLAGDLSGTDRSDLVTVSSSSLRGPGGGGTVAVLRNLRPPVNLCRADFSGDGAVTVQDIYSFLEAFIEQSGQSGSGLSADVNRSGRVDVQDIYDFLSLWYLGCD